MKKSIIVALILTMIAVFSSCNKGITTYEEYPEVPDFASVYSNAEYFEKYVNIVKGTLGDNPPAEVYSYVVPKDIYSDVASEYVDTLLQCGFEELSSGEDASSYKKDGIAVIISRLINIEDSDTYVFSVIIHTAD